MAKILGIFHYRAYGLTIESEIEIPELVEDNSCESQIFISFGSVPSQLPYIKKRGLLFQASFNDFLLHIKNIASYRVQNGSIITIEPNNTASYDEVKLFLLGSVLGALFHQRRLLPIHGSAIKVGDEAIIITGNSAVGKSSIAAGLDAKGFPVLSDDISVLSITGKDEFKLHPGTSHLKLWSDILDYFHYEDNLVKVRSQLEKYYTPTKEKIDPLDSVSIRHIVCLTTKNTNGFSHEEIFGATKFSTLSFHTYRKQFIEGLDLLEDHFQQISLLSNFIKLHRISRAEKPIMVNELVDFFISRILLIDG